MLRSRYNKHIDQQHGILFQEEKIKELKDAIGPLSGRSLKFCSDTCLRRYLKDRNWNVIKAKVMLEETLKWRSSYKPEEIQWHEIGQEGETGSAYRANFKDRDGRNVLVMRAGKKKTNCHERQIRFMVYILENAIYSIPPEEGKEEMIWLVDFTGWSLRTSVSIRTAKEIVYTLQNHYPETLAASFLYNPPSIFEAFWKVIKVFLDPMTVQKVKFVYPKNKESMEQMQKHFDRDILDILPVEFGGKNNIEYDHREYSKLMKEDDIKISNAWALSEKLSHDTIESDISSAAAPEPPTKT